MSEENDMKQSQELHKFGENNPKYTPEMMDQNPSELTSNDTARTSEKLSVKSMPAHLSVHSIQTPSHFGKQDSFPHTTINVKNDKKKFAKKIKIKTKTAIKLNIKQTMTIITTMRIIIKIKIKKKKIIITITTIKKKIVITMITKNEKIKTLLKIIIITIITITIIMTIIMTLHTIISIKILKILRMMAYKKNK